MTQKGRSNSEMWSSWDTERDGFIENCVFDNQNVRKNRNKHRQQERHFLLKNVRIHHSTISNNNRKKKIFCVAVRSQPENGQSNELSTLVNVKSKANYYHIIIMWLLLLYYCIIIELLTQYFLTRKY